MYDPPSPETVVPRTWILVPVTGVITLAVGFFVL
jgi:hypothetical protein